MVVSLNCLAENKPGPQWKALFAATWPYYQQWFLQSNLSERPGYLTSRQALEKTMPEIYPLYLELCALSGGGDLAARFLSLYCPPPFMSGCSQVAWAKRPAALIRNYDYNPRWFEGVMLRSHWLKPVIGISDCAWGLLDGMNGDGLCASMTFGGRKVFGVGFGVTLVLRYILETCSTVREAVAALGRIPVHMAYNVMLMDKTLDYATVYLGPDRKSGVIKTAICSNHQEHIDWPEYARATATTQREDLLRRCLGDSKMTFQNLLGQFLHSPLYNTDFANSFGTLYTAAWFPKEGKVRVIWPGKEVVQSFKRFFQKKISIKLSIPDGEATASRGNQLLGPYGQL